MGAIAKIVGIMIIIIIQFFGPPLIFLSRVEGFGVLDNKGYKWQCCPWHWTYNSTSSFTCAYEGTPAKDVSYFDDWYHVKSTKALGMLMMLAFILNGLFVLLDEKDTWKQIYNTFRYLDVMNPRFRISGMPALYTDAIMNMWVITWCCLDVFLVIGSSQSPSSVLMDALSLVFLYNLDDVGGDLGFVNEDDWPGSRLAWIYKNCVHPCPDEFFDEDKFKWSELGWAILSLYTFITGFLVVMSVGIPAVAAVTPFIQIVPS